MPRDLLAVAHDLAELVTSKRRAYGDSAGKVAELLRVLYPTGIAPTAYHDALLVVRVADKLCRLAHAAGRPDAGGESPWLDVAGYALLALARAEGGVR